MRALNKKASWRHYAACALHAAMASAAACACAEAACDMMTKAGFTGLTNMTGGFDDWAAQKLPVEK